MKPRKPIKRRVPVKRQNQKRRRKRQQIAFGGKAAFIRHLPCVVEDARLVARSKDGRSLLLYPDQCWTLYAWGPSEAAHTKSRGAGGTAKHLIPLCMKHHNEQHETGIKTFARNYGLNLEALSERYEAAWQNFVGLQEKDEL